MQTLKDEIEAIERRNRAACENGVLKDGHSIRIPLFMADSAPEDRRVADAFERGYRRGLEDARNRKVTQRDPFGRVKSIFEEESGDDEDEERRNRQRNGDATPMTTEDALTRLRAIADHNAGLAATGAAEKEKAYREMCDQQSSAWKSKADSGPNGGVQPAHGALEGELCMTDKHEPGVMVREGSNIVCRARSSTDARPTHDRAEGERIKQQAWEQMVNDQANAWKGKGEC